MYYRYQRTVTAGPNGATARHNDDPENPVLTELAVIDGTVYLYAPDGAEVPEQHSVTLEQFAPDEALLDEIREHSPAVRHINAQVVQMIRDRYTPNDEIKLLRLAPSPETAAWNDYAEDCRQWGRDRKAEIGL